ncbi:glycosyltransferase [Colwellia hornerae]|uniref:Glycosyltransferase family 4 protein n=1 Tax=Colwellia hornerae TaxID=89402 RepID=A0A5C6QI30_9GAMM|nr:glycosyltransferase [Colwellia hornerae]TWX52486.1 glycosyltransferase family 4 protein [Colwellia hornerae]TWX58315.1 glycosyltransferase family 4 protein [Colwellia hornerae]TWX68340.1 glycosyltransferase family 4 protein [Colwellia hornerae]
MSKKVLMVAFDYPPSRSVAGQRTLRMTQYLPEFGWEPLILTAKTEAYDGLDNSQIIPSHMKNNIYRTMALDVDRHLSIKGKHFNWMKVIDRWSTWIPTAIYRGLEIIKQEKPDVIWSTYPTMSAHIIANVLAKKTGIPLIVDYQDPLGYIHKKNVPSFKKKISLKVDKAVLNRCRHAIFATDEAKQAYIDYHQMENKDKFHCIENGYDESNFDLINSLSENIKSPFSANKFSLYYSGVLYPDGRDPTPTFYAIAKLIHDKVITSSNFELVFQGSGDGLLYKEVLEHLKIHHLVTFLASVPFVDSLKNMMDATALLLIQDDVFNLQVPGKLFEYIRAKKPVLVAAPLTSATGQVADKSNCGTIAHSKDEIYHALKTWLSISPKIESDKDITIYSRYEKAKQLSLILDKTIN